jgi:mono/diheme cytochrome c family protein
MVQLKYAVMAVLALAASTAAAEDPDRGRLLYENHCTVCHTSVAHVREDRKAATPAELLHQITRWSTHLELSWHGSEREDVAAYLNQRYYRFPNEARPQ